MEPGKVQELNKNIGNRVQEPNKEPGKHPSIGPISHLTRDYI